VPSGPIVHPPVELRCGHCNAMLTWWDRKGHTLVLSCANCRDRALGVGVLVGMKAMEGGNGKAKVEATITGDEHWRTAQFPPAVIALLSSCVDQYLWPPPNRKRLRRR